MMKNNRKFINFNSFNFFTSPWMISVGLSKFALFSGSVFNVELRNYYLRQQTAMGIRVYSTNSSDNSSENNLPNNVALIENSSSENSVTKLNLGMVEISQIKNEYILGLIEEKENLKVSLSRISSEGKETVRGRIKEIERELLQYAKFK